jgi:hypothetical protein
MTLEVETGRSCYPFAPESQRVRISAQIYLLTLNQRVHGSSPCAPTIEINELRRFPRLPRVAAITRVETRARRCPRGAHGQSRSITSIRFLISRELGINLT